MKKKLLSVFACFVLTTGALSGCGGTVVMDVDSESVPAASEQESVSELPVVESIPMLPDSTDPDEGKEIIGVKSDILSVLRLEIVNSSGQVITGLSITNEDGSVSSGNLMTEDQELEINEAGVIYYDSEQAVLQASASNTTPSYHMVLSFLNGETKTLSNVPFQDTDSVNLFYIDDVLYLTYQSASQGTEISTKEAEQLLQIPLSEPTEVTETEEDTSESSGSRFSSSSSSSSRSTSSSSRSGSSGSSSGSSSSSSGSSSSGGSSQESGESSGSGDTSSGGSSSGGLVDGGSSGGSSSSGDNGSSSGGSTSGGGSGESSGGSSSGSDGSSGGSSSGGDSSGGANTGDVSSSEG